MHLKSSLPIFALTLLCHSILSAQPNFMHPVAHISAQIEGVGEEIGAGLIAGVEGGKLYLLTAYHVVEGASEISATYYKIKEPVKGKLLHADEATDLAVLELPAPQNFDYQQLVPADSGLFEEQKKVVVVGHPGGNTWRLNHLNMVQQLNLDEDERLFSVTPQAVVGGNSGGPVFLPGGAWLGIVTETSMVEARCVKAQAIVEWLRELKVPTDKMAFALPPTVLLKGGQPRTKDFFIEIDGESLLEHEKMPKSDLLLGREEVTVAEFEQFVIATGYQTDAERLGSSVVVVRDNQHNYCGWVEGINWRHDEFGQTRKRDKGRYPVIHVSWNDASAYCEWLSRASGRKVRLPSAEEWAYACWPKKAGATAGKQPFGNIMDATWHDSIAVNFMPNAFIHSYLDGQTRISPQGSFPLNEHGLADLYGNLSEWCSDNFEVEGESGDDVQLAFWMGPNWLTWYFESASGKVVFGYPYVFSPGEDSGKEYAFQPVLKTVDANCFMGFRVVVEP